MSTPEGFGYVGAALLSTVVLLVGQSRLVSTRRKRASIPYPQMYADVAQEKSSKDALIFNCAQRAHQNTLENIPIVYVTTIIAGLRFPIAAASVCGLWVVSRVLYTRGYVTGDPKKRGGVVYGLATAGLLGNLFASIYAVGGWILEDINRK